MPSAVAGDNAVSLTENCIVSEPKIDKMKITTKRSEMKLSLGIALIKKLCSETKTNFVISPLSLGTAFTMLSAGLKGDTKKEVLSFVGSTDEAVLHKMYSDIIKNNELPFKIVNKYLAHDDCQVQAKFDNLLREKYESEIELVNFSKDRKKVVAETNTWVASTTNKIIKQLLNAEALTADTILLLLNAVCFKGSWMEEFDNLPALMDFRLRDGTKVKKHFMTKESGDFKYFDTDHLRTVKIMYRETECYMVIAIPLDEKKHIDEIIAKMTAAEMFRILDKLYKPNGPDIVLTMPKFKINFKYESIVDHMQALGVKKIFSAGEGDFGELFKKSPGPCKLSPVIHQAVIEVDEKGSEAEAAAATRFSPLSGVVEGPIKITIDRPFYFAIHTRGNLASLSGICFQP